MLDTITTELREGNMWVIFYCTRSKTGSEDQRWAEDVYLTDHWEIAWSREEAVKRYHAISKEYDVHVSGIAPIDPEYNSDWI